MLARYDKTDPKSIEAYGRKMIGHTFREIYKAGVDSKLVQEDAPVDYVESHARKNYKGGVGTLVEECYFGYKANNDAQPDFPEAGVELKVTPYVETRKTKANPAGFRAKERLVLTMINYMEIIKEKDFEHSHLWAKAQLMLLVWYLHIKGKNDIDSCIDFVQLFTPPPEDLEIIREDYEKIMAKIRAGKAHELSEGDTLYLGACTKAATAADRTTQPCSEILAKPRAFSFKNSYMTYVFTHYFLQGKVTYHKENRILKPGEKLTDFERSIETRITAYRGWSVRELAQRFSVTSDAKSRMAILAFRILGVTGNQCEEFEKAGIAVKTIRIQMNGRIRENMSFPPFRYQELAEETWDESELRDYLSSTRFFFIVYREDETGNYRLDSAKFWNIPYADLEGDVRDVWQETHDIIKEGRLTLEIEEDGKIVNNLPKKKDHPISHVRPHGRNREDTYPLPEGTHLTTKGEGRGIWQDDTCYTKQCFWLNNDYILRQIEAGKDK